MNAATATRTPMPDARPAPAEDPHDTLNQKLSQAHALSFVLFAESGEAFRRMNVKFQDDVCWLMSDLLGDCMAAKEQVMRHSRGEPSLQAVARELLYAHQVIAAFAGRLKEQDAPRAQERTALLARLGFKVTEVRS